MVTSYLHEYCNQQHFVQKQAGSILPATQMKSQDFILPIQDRKLRSHNPWCRVLCAEPTAPGQTSRPKLSSEKQTSCASQELLSLPVRSPLLATAPTYAGKAHLWQRCLVRKSNVFHTTKIAGYFSEFVFRDNYLFKLHCDTGL